MDTKTPFKSFGCRCKTQEEHNKNTESKPNKPMSQRIKDVRGKLTSEGYIPEPKEKVEVRGD